MSTWPDNVFATSRDSQTERRKFAQERIMRDARVGVKSPDIFWDAAGWSPVGFPGLTPPVVSGGSGGSRGVWTRLKESLNRKL